MPPADDKSKSRFLYEEACKVLPGGVSRNMIFRKPHPDYVVRGDGFRVTDVDGRTRIDFANNTAALIHGHAFPAIVEAVSKQLANGTAFNMATEAEVRLAQHLCSRNDGFDKIRFMNSGTEAVMAGIKVARAITGRSKIAKLEGAYHGTYDFAEVSQYSKPENWGDASQPKSAPVAKGTPESILNEVVVFPFNNIERTIEILDRHADELACVMIDPLPHRIGLIPATNDFMEAIRKWTTQNGTLFLLDEVFTFRMGYGGAQDWFGVEPDLTVLGKIIGGGFPVGALAGKDEYMSTLDPTSSRMSVPFSGTFSANPITMTAGQVAMEMFDRSAVERLNQLGEYTRKKISTMIESSRVKACVSGAGSMFRVHLNPELPTEYRSAYQNEIERAKIISLVDHMYAKGFVMINTCSGALSTVMTETEVDQMVEALSEGFEALIPK